MITILIKTFLLKLLKTKDSAIQFYKTNKKILYRHNQLIIQVHLILEKKNLIWPKKIVKNQIAQNQSKDTLILNMIIKMILTNILKWRNKNWKIIQKKKDLW